MAPRLTTTFIVCCLTVCLHVTVGNMDANKAHQEMQNKIQQEREKADDNIKKERAALDKFIKEEREKLFAELKLVYGDMDKNMQLRREEMDKQLKIQRAAMNQTLKRTHEKMNNNIKVQRAKMDFMTMQARADMDKNLQCVREEMDYSLRLQQVRTEAKMMQDRAKFDTKEEESLSHDIPSLEQPLPHYSRKVIMAFRVFKDREFSRILRGYGELPGETIITEPATKAEWSNLLVAMSEHKYNIDSELYYIKPGCVPPEGLVILLNQEDVDEMVRAHQDTKKCDLYLVTNLRYPGDGYDETSDEDGDDGLNDDAPFGAYLDVGQSGKDDDDGNDDAPFGAYLDVGQSGKDEDISLP
ncbi:hypothetical protein ACQ4PT_017913 [Festuca glaucescens]